MLLDCTLSSIVQTSIGFPYVASHHSGPLSHLITPALYPSRFLGTWTIPINCVLLLAPHVVRVSLELDPDKPRGTFAHSLTQLPSLPCVLSSQPCSLQSHFKCPEDQSLTVMPTLTGSFPATSWQMDSSASSLLLPLNRFGASSSRAFLNSS